MRSLTVHRQKLCSRVKSVPTCRSEGRVVVEGGSPALRGSPALSLFYERGSKRETVCAIDLENRIREEKKKGWTRGDDSRLKKRSLSFRLCQRSASKIGQKVAKIAQFFFAGLRPAPRRAAALDPSWTHVPVSWAPPSPPRAATVCRGIPRNSLLLRAESR